MYRHFNNYIEKEFFPKENIGETIILSVDESLINSFIEQNNISYENFCYQIAEEINENWKQFTIKIDDCFGLCAIQVYIAHQMHKDGDFTSRQYNPRLARFLNIDTNKLQRLYSGSQDKIWHNLKLYSSNNNFSINIPSASFGPGCNLQYPFSQTLLNEEDLKKAPILFEKVGIKKSDYFPFNEFSKLIENADNSYCMSTHYYRVKDRLFSDLNSINQLHQQLFNFFINKWDGLYLNTSKNIKHQNSKKVARETSTFVLSENLKEIFVLNFDYDLVNSIPVDNDSLFDAIRRIQELYVDEFLIFEKDNSSGESTYVRKFEVGKQYVLICKKYSSASKYISSLTNVEILSNSYYDIFLSNVLSKKANHHYWGRYFSSQSRNYLIESGLKLNYNTWMFGCGPNIKINNNSAAWLNGKILSESNVDCSQLAVGIYRLKVDGFPPERFEIKEPNYALAQECNGWVVNNHENIWESGFENSNIIGLFLHFNIDSKQYSVRNWINYLTTYNANSLFNSQLSKAIQRSKPQNNRQKNQSVL